MHLSGIQLIKAMFILILTAFTLLGCRGKLFSYNGDKVTQQDRMVQLKDGDQTGEWKTSELEIKYQYHMFPETLKVAGSIVLVGGIRYFSHLAVYLLYLDNEGIVIENSLIYAGENYRPIVTLPMDFEKKIPIPGGVRTISFAYDLNSVHR
jgi:hypothetical protein